MSSESVFFKTSPDRTPANNTFDDVGKGISDEQSVDAFNEDAVSVQPFFYADDVEGSESGRNVDATTGKPLRMEDSDPWNLHAQPEGEKVAMVDWKTATESRLPVACLPYL